MTDITTYPHNDGEHIIDAPVEHASVETFDAWLAKVQEDAAAGNAAALAARITEGVGYAGI